MYTGIEEKGEGNSKSLMADIQIKTIVWVKSNSLEEPADCNLRIAKNVSSKHSKGR